MTRAPEGILCSETHEWILEHEGNYLIGLSDHAIERLGDIIFVELPEVGANFEKGESFAVIESVKAANEIYMPIGGKIVEVNEHLVTSPDALNDDMWGNWLVKIEAKNASEDIIGLVEYEDYTD